MTTPNHITRRGFIGLVTGAVGSFIAAAVGLPALAYLIDPALKSSASDAWVPLGTLENIPIGVPTLATFTRSTINGWEKTVNSYGMFVLRRDETETLVLWNKCTHLGCQVNWKPDRNEFVCPCHDAQFDINGDVLAGPPPRPLYTYSGDQLKVEDGILYLHFLEG